MQDGKLYHAACRHVHGLIEPPILTLCSGWLWSDGYSLYDTICFGVVCKNLSSRWIFIPSFLIFPILNSAIKSLFT
jgi:hypothetical protein